MATKVSESSVISPELDYKSVRYMHPNYRYLQLFQQTGGNSVTITPDGTTESIFEVPTQSFCLADSFISGIATTTALGTVSAWHYDMAGMISEISLYTRSGRQLASINNLQNVLTLLRPLNTSIDEFLTSDNIEGLFPSDDTSVRSDGKAVSRPGVEPNYITIGAAALGGAGVYPFQFRLGSIKESIFALRKSLVFPDVILLRIAWGPGQRSFFTSTDTAHPETAPAPPVANITVSSMNMFLAVEQDEQIVRDLQTVMRGPGYSLVFPYITVYKNLLTTASQTVSIRIGRDKGHTLKKIVHSLFHAEEKKNTLLEHTNVAGAKVASYSTQLDSKRLQDYLITCASPYADYGLHKTMLSKTPLSSREIYQYNWFHCDDFSGLTVADESKLPVSKDNMVSGISLELERTWAFTATVTAASYNHYTIVVAYKTLAVTASSVDVM
jgi:hypothetical protein